MKILIDLPEEVSNHLIEMAQKKGWNRKQYIEWHLSHHSNLNKSRDKARSFNVNQPTKPST